LGVSDDPSGADGPDDSHLQRSRLVTIVRCRRHRPHLHLSSPPPSCGETDRVRRSLCPDPRNLRAQVSSATGPSNHSKTHDTALQVTPRSRGAPSGQFCTLLHLLRAEGEAHVNGFRPCAQTRQRAFVKSRLRSQGGRAGAVEGRAWGPSSIVRGRAVGAAGSVAPRSALMFVAIRPPGYPTRGAEGALLFSKLRARECQAR